MEITVKRKWLNDISTIGELSIDGKFQCFTLEDVERHEKIFGHTAIPPGEYDFALTFSPRFNMKMPQIMDVPNFSGVRIHWGNDADDTEGCILVGKTRAPDFIGKSRIAYAELMQKLQPAFDAGESIKITIEDV